MRNTRMGGICAVFCLTLLLGGGGCVKNKVIVKVNKDGSGTIVVGRVYPKETVAMYEMQMKQMPNRGPQGAEAKPPKDPFFNEAALKREAKLFGTGVQFVSAKKYDQDGGRGSVASYQFKDVNEVMIRLEALIAGTYMSMSMMEGMGEGAEEMDPMKALDQFGEAANTFEFAFEKGPKPRLKIISPQLPAASPQEPADAEEDAADMAKEQAQAAAEFQMAVNSGDPEARAMAEAGGMMGGGSPEAMMSNMYKSMRMTLVLDVDGTVVKSNASHVDAARKNRFTLMDIDMGKMMGTNKNPTRAMQQMEMMSNPSDFFGAIQGKPGVVFETNKTVNIEFQ